VSRSFALRLLETFFRRWWLCLLPAVLLIGLGSASVANAKSQYLSSGVLYVESQTLLSKLTGTDTGANTFLTPAQDASSRLNSLLGTDEFIRTIIDRAGLRDAVNAGLLSIDQVRGSIGTSTSSANTLRVGGSSLDPHVAASVAKATIDSFIQWVIDSSVKDSDKAEEVLNALAQTYKADADAANAALARFVSANPEPIVGYPAAQQSEIQRLQNDFETASDRYSSTLSKAEDARLNSAQARSNVEGRLRLVDAPTVPTVSTFSLVKVVMRLAMFATLGLALSAAAVFVGTVTDKSIRGADEIRERLGVPLLAVIPDSRFAAVAAHADMVDSAPMRRGQRRRLAKRHRGANEDERQRPKDEHAQF
jgi:uncharacterized protein involved in exopolysaccharide biosynthesis